MSDKQSVVHLALIAEYTALKGEQAERIVLRDTCLYISISASTAIAAVYAQYAQSTPRVLLLIPFASTLLFWVYATNDLMVTQIRRYIIDNIVPNLSSERPDIHLFGWEYIRRRRSFYRVLNKICRIFVVWFSFSGASIIALWLTAPAGAVNLWQDQAWTVAAILTSLPYILGIWLIDL